MNKKKLLVGVAIWALIVALTLLLYFTILDDYSKLRTIALVFVLLAQTIALGVFIMSLFLGAKNEKVMFNAGSFSLLGIYVAATLIVSIIFMWINKGQQWLVLLDVSILILFAIVFILILFFSHYMGAKNSKILEAAANVKRLEIVFQTLKNDPQNSAFSAKLNKLYEAAKYCDCSVFCGLDDKIENQSLQLEAMLNQVAASDDKEKSTKETNLLIDGMLVLYKRRGEEVKASKSGSF